MAEAAISNHTIALTLTYADLLDGTRPVGSIAFKYSDVGAFLKRLRQRIFRKFGKVSTIRFACFGEKGSRGTKRIHYHILLFSDVDLTTVGNWVTTDGKEGAFPEKNHHWDVWGHGQIKLQVPGFRGISYVMKYIGKDNFSANKSLGHGRSYKAPQHIATLFRMSKKPPIGDRYLEEIIRQCRERQNVLPRFEITIPNYKYYWRPTGRQAEMFLIAMHDINEDYKSVRGYDTPCYTSLVSDVSKKTDALGVENKLLECLYYGAESEEKPTDEEIEHEFQKLATDIQKAQNGYYRNQNAIKDWLRCSGPRPCESCITELTVPDKVALDKQTEQAFFHYLQEKYPSLPTEYHFRSKPWCDPAFEKEWKQFTDEWRLKGQPAKHCVWSCYSAVTKSLREVSAIAGTKTSGFRKEYPTYAKTKHTVKILPRGRNEKG